MASSAEGGPPPGTGASPVVALVAGEASGDLIGADLIRALRELRPDLRFTGIGGPRMEAAGMDILYPLEKLAVRGYVEVIRHLPELLSIRRRLARHWLKERPAAFIGIDAPDFNFTLETKLKAAGIPTIHYVSPSIWMWRRERLARIKRAVDRMLVLFPFETQIYEQAGMDAVFVGHPSADTAAEMPPRAALREQYRIRPETHVVALLPGSRQSELKHLSDVFIQTARKVHEQMPEVTFLAPLATRETRDMFERAVYRNRARDLPITIMFAHAHDAMAVADVGLIASGTATLEAALLGCPMVIAYRMPRASYWLLKGKAYLPYVGLPNILSGEFIAPEFIQDDATADNLAQALTNLLADAKTRTRLRAKFSALAGSLQHNASQRAAEAVLPLIGQGGA